jgi:hypothetical protein
MTMNFEDVNILKMKIVAYFTREAEKTTNKVMYRYNWVKMLGHVYWTA